MREASRKHGLSRQRTTHSKVLRVTMPRCSPAPRRLRKPLATVSRAKPFCASGWITSEVKSPAPASRPASCGGGNRRSTASGDWSQSGGSASRRRPARSGRQRRRNRRWPRVISPRAVSALGISPGADAEMTQPWLHWRATGSPAEAALGRLQELLAARLGAAARPSPAAPPPLRADSPRAILMRVIFARVAIRSSSPRRFPCRQPGSGRDRLAGMAGRSSVGVLVARRNRSQRLAVALLLCWLLRFSAARAHFAVAARTPSPQRISGADPRDGRGRRRRPGRGAALRPQGRGATRRAALDPAAVCQAAQSAATRPAAKKFFTTMLDRPETEFLGAARAAKSGDARGDRTTARRLAGRAAGTQSKDALAGAEPIRSRSPRRRWEAARDTLAQAAVKHRIVAPATARHHRGVIFTS